MPDISPREFLSVFTRIGVLSFGGPAAQIALMHRTLVDERKWISEDIFLRALSLCMLLPGPEAMQLATYAGWRLRGVSGGIIAGLLFVLPGALVISALAVGYSVYGDVPLIQAAFLGIKAAVIVIVVQAVWRLARKTLQKPIDWGLAGTAFLALFVFALPFPLIVIIAGAIGAVCLSGARPQPPPPPARHAPPWRTIGLWGALWIAPVALVWALDQDFLTDVALFFSKLAVVSFGGAYAVLTYMTQSVVQDFGWITTQQMIDALGLAETTPGPLILVTQFVAMVAGFAQDGAGLAFAAGLLCLWVTFVPCFLWIFLAGPYLDTIAGMPRATAALRAITAAVVGVILNLALWFALHTLFAQVSSAEPLPMPLPVWNTLDLRALVLTGLAATVLFLLQGRLLPFLAVMALAGVGTHLL